MIFIVNRTHFWLGEVIPRTHSSVLPRQCREIVCWVTATQKYSHVQLKQSKCGNQLKVLDIYHKALKYSIQSYAFGGGEDDIR